MLAPTTTLVAILLLGSALILLVWSVGRRFPRVARMSTLSFWCPFRARQVTAEFQEDAWNGRLLDVQSCDAFTPPTAVGCDKLCLHLRRLPTHAMGHRAP